MHQGILTFPSDEQAGYLAGDVNFHLSNDCALPRCQEMQSRRAAILPDKVGWWLRIYDLKVSSSYLGRDLAVGTLQKTVTFKIMTCVSHCGYDNFLGNGINNFWYSVPSCAHNPWSYCVWKYTLLGLPSYQDRILVELVTLTIGRPVCGGLPKIDLALFSQSWYKIYLSAKFRGTRKMNISYTDLKRKTVGFAIK